MSETHIVSIPLSRLNPITNGVRKTNGVSIESLAASIRTEGLLQNLTVVPAHEGVDGYTVIAGSRRLRALRSLAERGELASDFQVPCRVVAETDALSASLAENAIREQMHPADVYTAFRDMHAQGRTIEDIAARFGVMPIFVQRQLKLANVSPKLFELFRTTNEINLAQMMALAISDDHKAQETAWFKAEQWQRRPEELKRTLTKKEASFAEDSIAKFVGRTEYQAAGGAVHEDLFGGADGGYATDAKLLQTIAAKKLDAAAEAVRKEGWSWVEVRPEISYSDLSAYHYASPTGHKKPTDVDKKRIAELTKERGELDVKIAALEKAEEEGEERQSACERHEEVSEEIRGLQAGEETWAPGILAKAGAIVTVQCGELIIHRGRSKTKIAAAAAKGDKGGKDANPKADLSDALRQDLTSRVSYAMRVELAANADLAIIALTHCLALARMYAGTGDLFEHPVKIGADGRSGVLGIDAADCVDVAKLEQMYAEWKMWLPKNSTELFAWLISPANRPQIVPLLAYCTACTVDVTTSYGGDRRRGEDLANAIKLDMTTRWTPKAGDFLKRVSSDQVISALTDAGATPVEIAAAKKANKRELVEKALPILSKANWLPKPLRFVAAPVAASPVVPPKAAAKAAAKPTRKAKPNSAAKSAKRARKSA